MTSNGFCPMAIGVSAFDVVTTFSEPACSTSQTQPLPNNPAAADLSASEKRAASALRGCEFVGFGRSDFQKNATVFSRVDLDVSGVTVTGGGAQPIAQNGFQAVNSTGLLPNDRPHVFKMSGTWRASGALEAGAIFNWMSGTPLNRFGAGPFGYPRFLAPRGSVGRTT